MSSTVFSTKKSTVFSTKKVLLCACYRYESWIENGEGRTATVAFQKKHWFDTDITLRWLRHLRRQYPNKKIGLIWDHAPAHDNERIREFIRTNSDWLTTALIPGGLTSVMQVCDLVINKPLKGHIRTMYYQWRSVETKRLRLTGTTGKINLKIPRDTLIDICERAVKKMNQQQHEKPTIRTNFRKAGQDPFVDCTAAFKAHLDSLSKDVMYKRILDQQTHFEP